jgi:DNA repair protein RadC
MGIERWPEGDRPRERLYWHGPRALADAELLALQLGSGTRGRSAIDVAREMLATYGSLTEVAAREVTELAGQPGVGPVKAARLAAAFELTRRLRGRRPGQRIALSTPAAVHAAYGPLMEDLKHEVFRVALLDAQNGLLRDRIVSEGTLSASLVHPREVFKPAIVESAASVILVHNGGVRQAPGPPRARPRGHRPRRLREPGRAGRRLTAVGRRRGPGVSSLP